MKVITIQKNKKGNGSENTDGLMANVYVEQDVDATRQEEMIAVAAYFRAEERGFAPGNEMMDWLQAEAEYKNRSSPNAD